MADMIRNRTELDGDPAEHYVTALDWLRSRCDSTTDRLDYKSNSVLTPNKISIKEKAS